eukprot:CAMPEP_0184008710 /NCGR_PEP_ID=MMETSP0954-20121128/2141_1 /TAXON_ID=627963 /ORGANISM="Aplanochytrium sp, Strain PBS07" /LENGTH=307 /DNA_ID=CAMNT_0026287883 /DNA_START=3 /DNA_END=923 /DNA_ORIENTATION=-
MILQGLTECRDAGLTSVQTNDEFSLDCYKELDAEGLLPLRVHLTSSYKESNTAPYESKSGMLDNKRIKLFADGSLGAGTAAIRDASSKGYSGMLLFELVDLKRQMKLAHDNGYQIETHCIGDAAADQTLRALEETGIKAGDRPILTHCQVLGNDLIERMASIGAIADVQPSFVPTDTAWVEKRLKPEQIKWSYCWQTLIKRGVHVAGSSDAPIESCSPLKGMYDAIYRPKTHVVAENDDGNACFLEEEKLTFWQALNLYTLGANYCSKTENVRGRIEVGYDADFVVLDKDVAANPRLLRTAEIVEVW